MRFTSNLKENHFDTIRWLVRYLIGIVDKGYFTNLKLTKGLEVHVDANFAGN